MKNIQGIQLIMESNEELLPDFFMDFPYICSCVEFDKYIDPVVPWHWHHAVELFTLKQILPGSKKAQTIPLESLLVHFELS